MSVPNVGEWPWLVVHGEHMAWYMRSFLIGDFSPGRQPIPNYVMELDGDLLAPGDVPTCGTCGQTPDADDLNVIERATGADRFLEAFRNGTRPWPPPTDPSTCWYCNGPMPQVKELDTKEFLDVVWKGRKCKKSKPPKMPACQRCEEFLERESSREGKPLKKGKVD